MPNPQYLFWQVLPPQQQTENHSTSPQKLDFRNWGLPVREVIRFGHKKSSIYYQYFDFTTKEYTNPLVKVERSVVHEVEPIKLIKSVAWRLDNNTWGGTFTWAEPIHSPQLFNQKVRTRVINELIELAEAFDLKARMLELFDTYQTLVSSYRDAGSVKFRSAIAVDDSAWLDVVNQETGNKPRDVLVQYLSIGLASGNATKNS